MTLPELTLLVALAGAGAASPSATERDTIAAVALQHYFSQHPPDEPVCIAVDSYQAPSKRLRRLLGRVRLDGDRECHFQEGRVVYSVPKVALVAPHEADADVAKFAFGDVSVFLEEYSYRLVKSQGWAVMKETPHPSNSASKR